MNKRLFTICFYVLAGILPAFAQAIDSQVEVERAYEVDIVSMPKMHLSTGIHDSIFNFNLDFDYSTFYRPYNDLYELSSAVTAGPLADGKVRQRWFYADISAAYPWTPRADIYISPRFGNRVTALLSYNHYSYWGSVPYTPGLDAPVIGAPDMGAESVMGDRMINRAGAVLAYRWRKGEVTLRGDYSSNYYAYNQNAGMTRQELHDGLSQHFDMAGVAVNVRSVNPEPTAFYYDLLLQYNYINQKRSLSAYPSDVGSDVSEHSFDLGISLGGIIRNYHKLLLDVDLSCVYPTFAKSDIARYYDKYMLKGYVGYQYERDYLRIDARLPFRNFYLSVVSMFIPDLEVEYEILPSLIWLNASVYNDADRYSFYDMAMINPWFDVSCGGAETGELGVKLGFRGAVKDRFVYSFNLGYEYVDRGLSFASDGIFQTINPMSGPAHSFVMDASLKWQSKDFYAGVEADYRYLSDRSAVLMAPAFRLKAVAEYNIRKRIFIEADVEYQTSCLGASVVYGSFPTGVQSDVWTFTVPVFVDLGVKLTYAVNHDISVYLEGGNLLNQKIQRLVNYYEPGVNVLIGARFSF